MTVAFNSNLTAANLNAKLISRTTDSSASGIIDFVNGVKSAGSFVTATSDTAFDATTWNAVTTLSPSKNAVRDVLVSMLGLWKTILFGAGCNGTASDPPAGLYMLNIGQASVTDMILSGVVTSTAKPIIHIASTDYPTIGGLAPKLKLKAIMNVNDTAPTGNFVVGLYPITRPATSGTSTGEIYTLGTVVSGSTVTFTAPAADSQTTADSTEFALPANGFYMLGVDTTATMAVSSVVQINAFLMHHNA